MLPLTGENLNCWPIRSVTSTGNNDNDTMICLAFTPVTKTMVITIDVLHLLIVW
jgi:hypothetical protein